MRSRDARIDFRYDSSFGDWQDYEQYLRVTIHSGRVVPGNRAAADSYRHSGGSRSDGPLILCGRLLAYFRFQLRNLQLHNLQLHNLLLNAV